MVKELKVTPFHFTVCIAYGNKRQLEKVIEELSELSFALSFKGRDEILEELADVELVLPYIKHAGMFKSKLQVRNIGTTNFLSGSSLLSGLLNLKLKEIYPTVALDKAIEAMAVYVSASLIDIYLKYDISTDEVDEIKRYKMKRTIKRVLKIGG